ncbi:unnamed protein product [Onchocerca flexuosa]|uniref:Uncharacterized protein n=1 Tax=Onchocerca flexuosa TaxID=387005 RepID=A0A183HFA7_9BILA|nr:unnamed protein product [Onchocerca flexuosa]
MCRFRCVYYFRDLNRNHLKDDRSNFPDENQLSKELTFAQLHEIVQFFDPNVENNIEQTHPLNFNDRNYGFLLWGFIFSILIMIYYRTLIRRPVIRFRIFRFMLRQLRVL